MKIMELNEKELMTIDGGAKKKGKKDCKRDWGGVAVGAGKTVAGTIGYLGAIDDDGNANRGNYIRDAMGNLVKSGWNQMGDGLKCKKH